MSRRLPSWIWIPALLFLVLLAQGASLGLSDDEAYHWILAHHPSMSYAYHPPAIGWSVAIAEWSLGRWIGEDSAGLVRLPAALTMAWIVGAILFWIKSFGIPDRRIFGATGILLSFAGLFGLGWMIVPDTPLFLGWTLAFIATWALCFSKPSGWIWFMLVFGTFLSIVSKYSGVFVAGSAGLAVLIWAPKSVKLKSIFAVIAGAVLALIPILIWNSQHEWGSILYQIRGRHGNGQISWIRYGRFWLVELVAAGPILIFFAMKQLFQAGKTSPLHRFVWVWMLPPALVFLIQPLGSDFKPHWAFIVWWPAVILMAWEWAVKGSKTWFKVQMIYGLSLVTIVFISCHFPIARWVIPSDDPRLDVTNDLYGWKGLGGFIQAQLGEKGKNLPVIGSRYQTASQAAFALGTYGRATLLPRDLKAKDEWPDLNVSDGVGPDWPRLKSPILFVADNRYSDGPAFPGAQCDKVGRMETFRWNYQAKWIDLWLCAPGASKL